MTIFPVVKSNAYGHGLQQICKILDTQKTPYLCVDSFPEYQIVKKFTKKNILLIGETHYKNYKYFDSKRTTFCIYNIESIHYLGKKNKKIKIHLFLNTGMNREGLQHTDLINLLETLKKYPKIQIEWVLSHLYNADDMDSDKYQEQIQHYKNMHNEIINYGHSPKYRHIANSAWYLRITDSFFNATRIGLSLYGYTPVSDTKSLPEKTQKIIKKLQPALRITSKIITKQIINKYDGVSYNHRFINEEDENLIGSIPFWYMEGIPRNASGKITFRYKKEIIRQTGTICMNLSSCLLPHKAKLYDRIEIITPQWENTLWKRAKKANMSIYEILVKLDRNIRREIE